jgi:nitrate/nitrite-specific signal transduction histidine kinase
VRLPTRSFWSVSTGVIAPVQIALLPSVFLVAILFIQFAVVRPVRRLTAAAGRISVGEQADLGVGRISRESGNEIHQLILATERLRASLMLAIQRGRRQPPPG